MCDGGAPSLRDKAFQGCSSPSGVQSWAPHNLEYISTKHHVMFCKGCGTCWRRLGDLLTEFYWGEYFHYEKFPRHQIFLATLLHLVLPKRSNFQHKMLSDLKGGRAGPRAATGFLTTGQAVQLCSCESDSRRQLTEVCFLSRRVLQSVPARLSAFAPGKWEAQGLRSPVVCVM